MKGSYRLEEWGPNQRSKGWNEGEKEQISGLFGRLKGLDIIWRLAHRKEESRLRFLSLEDGLNLDVKGEMKYKREAGLEKKITDVCDVKAKLATTLPSPPDTALVNREQTGQPTSVDERSGTQMKCNNWVSL